MLKECHSRRECIGSVEKTPEGSSLFGVMGRSPGWTPTFLIRRNSSHFRFCLKYGGCAYVHSSVRQLTLGASLHSHSLSSSSYILRSSAQSGHHFVRPGSSPSKLTLYVQFAHFQSGSRRGAVSRMTHSSSVSPAIGPRKGNRASRSSMCLAFSIYLWSAPSGRMSTHLVGCTAAAARRAAASSCSVFRPARERPCQPWARIHRRMSSRTV